MYLFFIIFSRFKNFISEQNLHKDNVLFNKFPKTNAFLLLSL